MTEHFLLDLTDVQITVYLSEPTYKVPTIPATGRMISFSLPYTFIFKVSIFIIILFVRHNEYRNYMKNFKSITKNNPLFLHIRFFLPILTTHVFIYILLWYTIIRYCQQYIFRIEVIIDFCKVYPVFIGTLL